MFFELLSKAVEGGQVGTWYWDISCDKYEWSDLCREYFALPEGRDPSLAHFYSVLHHEDKERIKLLVRGAFENAVNAFKEEYRVIEPNGNVRWLLSSWSVQRDQEGRACAMVGIVIDISESKANEAQLREAFSMLSSTEQRFRLAMDAAQEGIWDWNLDTDEVYYSPGYAAMLGYAPNSIRSHVSTWTGLLHPDEAEDIIKEAGRLLRNIGHYSLEFRLRHADGSYRWILSKGKVIKFGKVGEPLRAIGTHIDITELKESEKRLEESRQLLNLALAGAELGTWDVDVRTGHSLYDERYCAILGYRVDELDPTMESWLNRIHPEDRYLVNEAMRAHLAGETRIYEAEHRLRHKSGHWVWVLAQSS